MCDSANNGEEALELIRHDVQHMHKGKFCSYALILLDCQMPVMDGFECTREVRRYLDSLNIVQPIITAMTGHINEKCSAQAKQSGFNQVLSKPVKPELLVDLCHKLRLTT